MEGTHQQPCPALVMSLRILCGSTFAYKNVRLFHFIQPAFLLLSTMAYLHKSTFLFLVILRSQYTELDHRPAEV